MSHEANVQGFEVGGGKVFPWPKLEGAPVGAVSKDDANTLFVMNREVIRLMQLNHELEAEKRKLMHERDNLQLRLLGVERANRQLALQLERMKAVKEEAENYVPHPEEAR